MTTDKQTSDKQLRAELTARIKELVNLLVVRADRPAVRRAASLPPSDTVIWVLRYCDGLTLSQIGDLVARSPEAIRARLRKLDYRIGASWRSMDKGKGRPPAWWRRLRAAGAFSSRRYEGQIETATRTPETVKGE